ncbi:MAG: hypothetical protein WCL71_00210 [Deltaproteobacteria bacterium]
MTVEPLTPQLAEVWDRLLRSSDDGWVTSLSDWQTSISNLDADSLEDKSFLIFHDGAAVAGFPLQHNPWRRCLFSTAIGYGGPFLSNNLGRSFQKKVLDFIFDHAREIGRELGCERLEVSICPVTQRSLGNKHSINPLVFHGFDDTSTHARVLDLYLPEDQLWGGLSPDARQHIKKAKAAGYTVEKVSWDDHLDSYQTIHECTYSRTGAIPFKKEFHMAIQKVSRQGGAHLYAGFSPGHEPVAYNNTAVFGGSSRYWTGCCQSEQLKSGINYLLLWTSITSTKQAMGHFYEVGEIFPNERDRKLTGISVFKSKFGGEVRRSFCGKLELEDTVNREQSGREILGQMRMLAVKLYKRSVLRYLKLPEIPSATLLKKPGRHPILDFLRI